MRRAFALVALAFILLPVTAQAQVTGLRLDAGAAFLTKSGSFQFGPEEIESDAGWAVRGRLRYGFGAASLGADVQASSAKYGRPPAPGAPENLNATFIGVVGALHPFKLAGIAPYAEIGIGKLFYNDDSISTEGGSTASSYGLGVAIGGEGRLGLDVELRLLRQTRLTASGVAGEFKYDPKVFSVMLSFRL